MKNLLNAKTKKTLELQQQKMEKDTVYFIDTYVMPKAFKETTKGYYSALIKIPYTKRKYNKYLKNALLKKGFDEYDIKITKTDIFLQWK